MANEIDEIKNVGKDTPVASDFANYKWKYKQKNRRSAV